MRIESFWAKGFRSLRDVRLDGLGAFNVLRGPNGAGKSAILEAMQTLLKLAAAATRQEPTLVQRPLFRAQGAIEQGIVQQGDLCAHDASRILVLGARFSEAADAPVILRTGPLDLADLSLEVTLDWTAPREPKLFISTLRAGDQDLLGFLEVPFLSPLASSEARADQQRRAQSTGQLQRLLLTLLPWSAYGLIRADRSLHPEKSAPPPEGENALAYHLARGHVKSALLAAQIDPRHEVRRRLNVVRAFLAAPPFGRPPFDPVQDTRTGAVDVREFLPDPNLEGRDVSLDVVGVGVAQVYIILAQAMLLGARAIGVEHPEAHLHPPTTGRHLRQLLVRIVEERYIDQLFIATHAELFDLDPTGHLDVSLDKDGCTVVSRVMHAHGAAREEVRS